MLVMTRLFSHRVMFHNRYESLGILIGIFSLLPGTFEGLNAIRKAAKSFQSSDAWPSATRRHQISNYKYIYIK